MTKLKNKNKTNDSPWLFVHYCFFCISMKIECGATRCIPPCAWLGGLLVERLTTADRLHHNHGARVPAVPAGIKCCCLKTQTGVDSRVDKGMCC